MALQDEINQGVYRYAFKTSSVSINFLKWALKKIIEMQKSPKGIQSVKQLLGQGQGIQYMPIHNKNIDTFIKNAKKFGVDFSVVPETDGKNFTVFFKSKDVEAFDYILKSLVNEEKNKGKGKSLDEVLKKAKNKSEKDKGKDLSKTVDKVFEKKQEMSR